MAAVLSVGLQIDLAELRSAQAKWAETKLSVRLRCVRRLRDRIARDAGVLADAFPAQLLRARAETLSSEIIPLADACRFLELEGTRILAPRRLGTRGRPLWMRSVETMIRREPHGVVLIIGPSNYPLFLAAAQTLQALVAGNAVVLKPGRNARAVLRVFLAMLREAGFPSDCVLLLDESVQSAQEALAAGVDKIVVTGSVQTGRAVLREAAEAIIPVTAELSGFDPVFVLPGADVGRAASAICFGIRLNGGNTCIAPRRVFVHAVVATELRALLETQLRDLDMLPITDFLDENTALRMAQQSGYALGASVFGEEREAQRFANRVCAGVVVVNDAIVPAADPRVPFGGRRKSGFGKTRGAEGLLEMTVSKAIVVQRGKRLRHLEPLPANAAELFTGFLAACHCERWIDRLRGWMTVCKTVGQIRAKQ